MEQPVSLHRGLSQILNIKRLRLNLSSSLETTGLWLLVVVCYLEMITISLLWWFPPRFFLPTFHNNHNYQWTYCNTTVLPTVNDAEGTPLIGAFLVSEEVEFILNGQKIKVNVK